jgi:DDE family transposase
MRITRFLHNPDVTVEEMLSTVSARTRALVRGRHVLAIQDTTSVRVDGAGCGLSLHPVIAVDAETRTLLGLVDACLLHRKGGASGEHKKRDFEDKESRRWLDGARSASALAEAGASCVTVIEDREGDIYECFAFKPANVEKLVRAGQNRTLTDESALFDTVDSWSEAGQMSIDLPAAPGRKARQATLSLRYGTATIKRPPRPTEALAKLPETVTLQIVDVREIDPPKNDAPAHWRLLTTHAINDIGDARQIVHFYRQRWTIEQLFRTLKTQGFNIEALRQEEDGPLEKLVAASLIAAITVMQLVAERDGKAKRSLSDAFDPDDQPVLERVCQSLEGKTAKQKNPHPKGSLAFAAWVFARLGGWTGYYGKPGPIVMLQGLTEFHSIKQGWDLRNV